MKEMLVRSLRSEIKQELFNLNAMLEHAEARANELRFNKAYCRNQLARQKYLSRIGREISDMRRRIDLLEAELQGLEG